LYIFCGEFLLCARLRSSNIDASAGSVEELHRIVAQIRSAWPLVHIVVRGDSGFCREELMAWCEANRVEYLLGLTEKRPSEGRDHAGDGEAKVQYQQTGRGGSVVQRVRLPDAEELEPRATDGGQGRALGKRREPAIRGDLSERRRMAGTGAV